MGDSSSRSPSVIETNDAEREQGVRSQGARINPRRVLAAIKGSSSFDCQQTCTDRRGNLKPLYDSRNMDGTNKTLACAVLLAFTLATRAAGEFADDRESDMVEGPRVERMHPETSDACVGSNCLQNSEGPVGAMWFGPRLGRRRRSDAKLMGKKIEALGEILGSPAWNFATSTGVDNKRQETPFTPRLGRELEDAISLYDLLHSVLSHVEDQDKDQTPPPLFPPRLGRNLAPRLEPHELRNLLRKILMK